MFTDLANYYQDKSVLVTGGASFIGSHLVDELIKFGSRVTVIDDLSSGSLLNINQVKEKIDFIDHDLRFMSEVEQYFKNVNIVFH